MLKWMKSAVVAVAVFGVTAPVVHAKNLEGPIRVIVGFTPGGGVDALARVTAQQLEEELGVSVIVENKPGAGGTLAADYVARTKQPNTTLLFGDSSLLVAPFIYPSVRYNLEEDFIPIGLVGEAALAIAVNENSPHQSLADVLTAAKAAKEPLTFSSVGVGSLHHLAGELLAQQSGVELLHVPYRGGAEASQALVSKDVDLSISSLASIMPLVSADKARLVAVLSEERFPSLKEVPTAGETIEGYVATPSLYIAAPKEMDPQVADQLEQALKRATETETVQQYFIKQGSQVKHADKTELKDWMQDETAKWKDLMDKADLQLTN